MRRLAGCAALGILAAALVAAAWAARLDAATGPPGFVIEPAFPGVQPFLPMQVVFLPDGRKFVVEMRGRILVFKPDGEMFEQPFIDINEKVMCCAGRGLLSVALDPDFETNRWVYLLYVADPDSDGVDFDAESECYSRLERVQASLGNPNVADLSTRQVLFGQDWAHGVPSADIYHTIGTIRFAPDKTLLVSTGDGAHFDQVDPGGLDPEQFLPGRTDPSLDIGSFRSLSLNTIGGKVLRLDKETGHGLPSNPWWDGDPLSPQSRIWVYGLRNPYRFCIKPGTGSTDPADGDPGTLYIGDTGWNTYEALYVARGGRLNFGWPCTEGPLPSPDYGPLTSTASGDVSVLCSTPPNPANPLPRTPPLVWWHHTDPSKSNPVGWSGRAIVGGTFQTGGNYPEPYQGSYYLNEFINGWIRRVDVDSSDNVVAVGNFVQLNAATERPIDLEIDPASGDLFYVTEQIGGVYGNVYRIRFLPTVTPKMISLRADSADGAAHYPTDSATSPWVDVAGDHDGTLVDLIGGPTSGWQGDGSSFSPYRLDLDGVDDHVEIPAGTIPELAAPAEVTTAMWFRTGTDVTRAQFLVEWVGDYTAYTGMRIAIENGQLRVWFDPWVDVAPLQALTWYHVAVTKTAGEARVYLNGTLVHTSATPLLGGADSRLSIGASTFRGHGNQTGEYFGGGIGQFHVWGAALDGSEVLANYQAGQILYHASSGLISSFRADSTNGSAPPAVPGAASPWRDLRQSHHASMVNFDGTLASGWRGDGSTGSPWRLQFDGVNDRVTIPAGSIPELQSPLSASLVMWFRTGADITADQRLIEWLSGYSPPFAGMSIGIADDSLRIYLDGWAAAYQVEPETWYHVAVTKQPGDAALFVNGIRRHTGVVPYLGSQVSEVVVGASTMNGPGSYSSFFKGSIGQFSLWRRRLVDPEIQDLLAEDEALYVRPPANPFGIVELRADSSEGTAAYPVPSAESPWIDLSGGHHGSLYSFSGDATSGWQGDGTVTSPWRLQFDGVDDRVVIAAGSIPALQSPGEASVSLWMDLGGDVTTPQCALEWLSAYAAPFPGMSVGVADDSLRVRLGTWRKLLHVNPETWHHVVVSKRFDAVQVVIDGDLAYSGTEPNLGGQWSEVVLGASTELGAGAYADWFAGAVAQVRLYDVALTMSEARDQFLAERDRFPGNWNLLGVDGSPGGGRSIAGFPNPFRRRVVFDYPLEFHTEVRLEIFSVDGRLVRVLERGWRAPGDHRVEWDGADDHGRLLPQGLYFARFDAGGVHATRRLVHLR